jgi:hypothetical protein
MTQTAIPPTLRLRWQIQPGSARRHLFCGCLPQHTSFPLSNAHRKTTHWIENTTPVPMNLPVGWQTFGGQPEHATKSIYAHARSGWTCDVQRKGAAPLSIEPGFLSLCMELARAFAFQTPALSYVMRLPRPLSEHPQGCQRALLLGVDGQTPEGRGACSFSSLLLKESPCLLLHHHPHHSHIRWESHGAPLLEWVTEWAQLPTSEWLQRLQSLRETVASSLSSPYTRESITLEWKQDSRVLAIEQIHSIPALAQVFHYLETHPSPRYNDWKEHHTWDAKQARPHMLGWSSTRPPKREPLLPAQQLPIPTQTTVLRWNWRTQWTAQSLAPDVIKGLLQTGRVGLFEQMRQLNPRTSPAIWGELLVRWPKALERKGLPMASMPPERWLALAALHGMGRCHREALQPLLALAAAYPDRPLQALRERVIPESDLPHPMTEAHLQDRLPALLAGPLPDSRDWPSRERFWMGRCMAKLRGTIEGRTVRWELYRYFSEYPPSPYDRCPFPPPDSKRVKRIGRPKDRHTRKQQRKT